MRKFFRFFFIAVIAIWFVNVLIGYVLQWRFREWEEYKIFFEPIRWTEFYQIPQNTVDGIFIGSSHAYRSIDPYRVDSVLNIRSFNFGTSGQSMRTSYELLKAVLEEQKPKTVVLELYFDALKNEDQLVNAGYNFQGMTWGMPKVKFWWGAFSFREKCIMLFAPTFQFRGEWEYVVRRLTGLSKSLPRGEYAGKGFVTNTNVVAMSRLQKKNKFNDYKFQVTNAVEDNLHYLRKIVALCREHDIRLIWVTAPVPHITYSKIKNTEEIHRFMRELAAENKVAYHDFLNPQPLALVDTVHFFDNNHLNYEGARIFTQQVIIPALQSPK